MQGTTSAFKSILVGLKSKGKDAVIKVQSSMKEKEIQKLGKVDCSPYGTPREAVQIELDKLLKMNKNGSSTDDEPETAVVETSRYPLWVDRAHKIPDVMLAQGKETSHWIEDMDIMLTYVKRVHIRESGANTREEHELERKQRDS